MLWKCFVAMTMYFLINKLWKEGVNPMWSVFYRLVSMIGKVAWKYKGKILSYIEKGWTASQIYHYGKKHCWF
ncbi:hypothetical protein EFN12_08675 [Pediococcus pentosaceus]|nr:hypothetical protein AN278_007025 [Pediococcus pentosaceus]AVL02731.1 hypothetical protein PP40703_07870 [Pediococcus pentosaceus]KQB82229.1 hypothetical protein AN278_01905 [Pediococcus pentosaceus]MCS8574706.1 hypothetical protein [Pediococcus pentosaceus]MCS8577549.1 hypothetical protein [Pediococcus pentosaceus]